jgi:hypothetical protein
MQQAEAPAAEAAMEPAGWECEVDGTWLAYPGVFLARVQAGLHAPSLASPHSIWLVVHCSACASRINRITAHRIRLEYAPCAK